MPNRRAPRRKPGKKISVQSFIGQEGINLIEKRLLEMGFLWVQHGAMEAGIDGHLELRDPVSGEVLNCIILVQSRATRDRFLAETETSLEYLCDERDLDYWMMGNAPVILIRSRPQTSEAYWVSVKDHFKDPQQRARRRISFNKEKDRFDLSARARLLTLGLSRDQGIYLTPQPRRETLYSNLLPVRLGNTLYQAQASSSNPAEIIEALCEKEPYPPREWRMSGNRLISIHDLADPFWESVVLKGTGVAFSTADWSQSDDPDRLRDFVFLLNRCLQSQLGRVGVRFDRGRRYYHWKPTADLSPRSITYKSLQKKTSRDVFGPYEFKDGRVSYYRHSAFEGHFRRYGGDWFLEINPTYHFTTDGASLHPFYESKLKGIKALEKNPAVLGQVWMWADLLRGPKKGLFSKTSFLSFGNLVTFDVTSGIDDKSWLGTEDGTEASTDFVDEIQDLPLFSPWVADEE